MKFQLFALICMAMLTLGCASDSNEGQSGDQSTTTTTQNPNQSIVGNVTLPDGSSAQQIQPPPQKEPAQNADGVWHYTCPNGCEGGAGKAEPCAKCGTLLAHNQAYHLSGPGGPQTNTITPQQINPQTMPQQNPPAAKNADGVWHFACTNTGCDGGAGSAGSCPKCGSALAHNQDYH